MEKTEYVPLPGLPPLPKLTPEQKALMAKELERQENLQRRGLPVTAPRD